MDFVFLFQMLPAEALWIKPQRQQLVRAALPSEKDLRFSWLLLRLFVASLRVTSLTSEYTRASFEVLGYVVSRWKHLVGWKTKLLKRQVVWPHGPGPLSLQPLHLMHILPDFISQFLSFFPKTALRFLFILLLLWNAVTWTSSRASLWHEILKSCNCWLYSHPPKSEFPLSHWSLSALFGNLHDYQIDPNIMWLAEPSLGVSSQT